MALFLAASLAALSSFDVFPAAFEIWMAQHRHHHVDLVGRPGSNIVYIWSIRIFLGRFRPFSINYCCYVFCYYLISKLITPIDHIEFVCNV